MKANRKHKGRIQYLTPAEIFKKYPDFTEREKAEIIKVATAKPIKPKE